MKYYGNKENFESNPWLFQKYFVSLWQLCVQGHRAAYLAITKT